MEVLPGYKKIALLASSKKNSWKVFFRPFPKPKRMMKIKIPRATVNPDKKVRNLFLPMVSNISLQRSLLNIC
jgi:hypothetical protein